MKIDSLLPSILRHENIARLNGDSLYIFRRDLYPFKKEYFISHSAEDSAFAIREMYTQGGGPLEVALQTMVLVALKWGKDEAKLEEATSLLSKARKTNRAVSRELLAIKERILSFPKENFSTQVKAFVDERLEYYDRKYLSLGGQGAVLIKDGDGILTTCFAEHSFFLSLALARQTGKRFTVYAMETRPYLQGAHLTAPSLAELGYEHYLITDNMAAFFIREGKVLLYLTACDLADRKGNVINKLGTLSSALACKAYGIPYYAFALARDEVDASSRLVEFRNEEDVRQCQGVATTGSEVKAIYPAFDVVDSSLVSGVITPGV